MRLNPILCRYVRLADDDITVGAVIIGTAEYCSEVVGALGRNVAKLLDPPLGDHVRADQTSYRVTVRQSFIDTASSSSLCNAELVVLRSSVGDAWQLHVCKSSSTCAQT